MGNSFGCGPCDNAKGGSVLDSLKKAHNQEKVPLKKVLDSFEISDEFKKACFKKALKIANRLEKEGYKMMLANDYVRALQIYEKATELTPNASATLHYNKSVCLEHIDPFNHEAVISGCSSALRVDPSFYHALYSRACAYEAIGKYDLAMQDVKGFLLGNPGNPEALMFERRLEPQLGKADKPDFRVVDIHDEVIPEKALFNKAKSEWNEFAQTLDLIDPDSHMEVGMEPCFQALEDTVTREEAQVLFDKAASKFQELAANALYNWGNVHMCATRKGMPIDGVGMVTVGNAYNWVKVKHTLANTFYEEIHIEDSVERQEAQVVFNKAASKLQELAALALFNWGNVHMCAARKGMPIDEALGMETVDNAYNWVIEKYTLAKECYEQALKINPDFYEGLLALGQKDFEMAKLHWSYVAANPKTDLSEWNSLETIGLLNKAEKQMSDAAQMLENKQTANEQAASLILLLRGDVYLQRSHMECELGFTSWETNLEKASTMFEEVATMNASQSEIPKILGNLISNRREGKEQCTGEAHYG